MGFSIGDKVVPQSKTATGMKDFEECEYWKHAQRMKQPFLYVIHINKDTYGLHYDPPTEKGGLSNVYSKNDVVAYKE